MEFRILGPLEAVDAGGELVPLGRGKRRALLAALLLNVNRTISVARLIDDLWGDEPPGTAGKAVQIYVSQLRKALPERILHTRSPGYVLELPPERVDLHRFERLAAEGRQALAAGKPEHASELLREALELWRGTALGEFEEPFAHVEGARLEELRLAALEERIEADLASGRHAELTAELETMLRRYPLRERLHGQQMLALYRAGRQAEALACYQNFRRHLDEELGIEPSARLRELERQILQQDAGLELAAPHAAASSPRGDFRAAPASPEREAGVVAVAERTPMVGRAGELGGLHRLLDEALAGHRQIVFVSGPAGVGKTTLVEAFLAEASAGGDLLGARGQCFEQYGAGEAYMPLLEALGRLCESPDGDEIVQLLAEHAPTWLSQMPKQAARAAAAAEPALAGVTATSERMLRELVEAVEGISALRPLVLLLEDLHWSDPSTVDVVNALARREEPARLVLLGTYRPGDARAAEHPVWAVAQELRLRALATEIQLTTLPPRAMVEYLDLRFPGNRFPIELPQLLHERTDGSPLFVEKVVDAWVETGSVASADETWQLQASIAELAIHVPATVRQLIEHQLDQLDPDDQQLVETAGAAGSEFATVAIAAAAGRDPEEVETRCAELAAQGRFFLVLGEEVWPDGTVSATCGFAHDLYQEIAYHRLPPGRRARLHRELGTRLEAAYGEQAREIASELAAHFARGRNPERAVVYLQLAAEQALARGGQREAIEHLTAALEALELLPATRERDERELAVRITLGNAMNVAHGYAAAETRETYARARELCAKLGDEAERFLPVIYGLWNNELVAGRLWSGRELGETFLRLAQAGADDAILVADRAVAWPCLLMGEFDAARGHLAPIVDAYDPERHSSLSLVYGEDPGVAGTATYAWSLGFLGFPDQAVEAGGAAIALAEQIGHPLSLLYALVLDAALSQFLHEPQAAAERAELAAAKAAEYGVPFFAAFAAIPRGWGVCQLGRVEDGIATMLEGLDTFAATGTGAGLSWCLATLGEAYGMAGRTAEGLRTLDDALAIAAEKSERFYETEIHRLCGELLLALDERDERAAEQAFERALEVARGQQARLLELRAATSLGRLWRDQGRRDEAGELLAGLYGWFTEGFETPDLTGARALLEELGVPIPEPVSAGAAPRPTPAAAAAVTQRAPLIVGREAELRRLRVLFDDARRGERRLVFVTGDAGQGKTTLVDAFVAEAGAAEELRLGRGQCVEQHGAGEAYMPVLEALGRMCAEPGGEEIIALVAERAPTWLAQLPWLVPPGDEPALARRVVGATTERMLREGAEALEAVASERPLLLVIEDLHWSDVSTVDLLAWIARRRDPAQLLVVGTYRSTDASSRAHPVHRVAQELMLRSLAAELPLGTLGEEALGDYLEARLPGAAARAGVAALLLGRTGGNPLFVEKVVDSWIEERKVAHDAGGWRFEADPAALVADVPDTVSNLVEQRLVMLAEGDRDILDAASVAGMEFSSALVAAVCERTEENVEGRCEELARTGLFIEPRGQEHWPDGTVAARYGFTHDLCGEVLYARLPAGRRARLHRRTGARLAEAYGDRVREIAPALAAHYVRGQDAAQAVRHLASAAELALGRSAPREALEHLQAAVALLDEIPDERERAQTEIGLRMMLGPSFVAIEGWDSDDAERALLRSRELAEQLGLTAELAWSLFTLGTMYEVRGQYERSEELLETALALPEPPARELLVDSHELLACSLFHQGAFDRALDHAEEAIGLWDGRYVSPLTATFGDNPGIASHGWAALALWFLGQPDRARDYARRSVVLAESAALGQGRTTALTKEATLAQLMLDVGATRRSAEAALEAAARAGYRLPLAMSNLLRGWALTAQGEVEEGLAALMDGLESARATGSRMDDSYFLGLLADARARAGRGAEALAALDEALQTVPRGGKFFYEAELHRLRGDLLLRAGEAGEGEASLVTALETARKQGARTLELRAAVSLARRWQSRGRTHEARELVSSVYAQFSEGFEIADLVAARELLEELGAAPTQPPPAAPLRGGPPSLGGRPPVRYARSGELSIAYQVTGAGAVDLVLVPGFVSHLEKDWEEPRHAHFLDRLGSFSRLIRFDKRGTGLSDRPGDLPDLETRMDDVRAVMDAAGSERAVLFGYSEGGPMSILFAATYPERVQALVLYGAYAKRTGPDEDYPWAETADTRQAIVESLFEEWGFESHMRMLAPSADEAMARWWNERCRAAASPGAVRALMEMNSKIDVREVLPSIHVPTLVLARTEDARARVDEGRYIAERIPGARFVELPGADHFVAVDPDQILDAVEPFVRESVAAAPAGHERVLKTILVTDIVGSTDTAARLGDAAWANLVSAHNNAVRDELGRFAGEEVDTAGDGFLALFDGPTRAIRCGLAVGRRLEGLGLTVRVGVHTGEIERRASDVRGIAVHLAARVAAEAAPGEVLVTATTRDLVEGSGLAFEDRGERSLKGVDSPRRLYAAAG